MTNRVALGALPGGGFGLRVSRPGFNVLDTGLTGQQLAFDSRWSFAARIHMEGTFSVDRAGSFGVYSNLSLGLDFGVPPPVLAMVLRDGGQRQIDEGNNYWLADGSYAQSVRIFSSYLSFLHPQSPLEPFTRVYKYIVFRPY